MYFKFDYLKAVQSTKNEDLLQFFLNKLPFIWLHLMWSDCNKAVYIRL